MAAALAHGQGSIRLKAYSAGLALTALAGLLVAIRDTARFIPDAQVLDELFALPYVALLPLVLVAAAGVCLLMARRGSPEIIHPARYATRRQLDIFSPRKAATAGAFTFSTRPGLIWSEDGDADGAGDEVIVKGIVIRARNDGAEPVKVTNAVLVSEKSAERLPMYAMLADGVAALDDLDAIPPGAEVLLESCLPDMGLGATAFRRQFGAFSFVVEYGGEVHEHLFDRDLVDASLRSTRTRAAPPGVTRTKGSKNPARARRDVQHAVA